MIAHSSICHDNDLRYWPRNRNDRVVKGFHGASVTRTLSQPYVDIRYTYDTIRTLTIAFMTRHVIVAVLETMIVIIQCRNARLYSSRSKLFLIRSPAEEDKIRTCVTTVVKFYPINLYRPCAYRKKNDPGGKKIFIRFKIIITIIRVSTRAYTTRVHDSESAFIKYIILVDAFSLLIPYKHTHTHERIYILYNDLD